MFCDGSCMRAFHCDMEKVASDDSTSDSEQDDESAPDHSPTKLRAFHCNPLDMPGDLYQHLKDTKDTFHCPNCLAGVHQCFKCKQEGVVEAHVADPLNARFAKELVFRCRPSHMHLTGFIHLFLAGIKSQRQVCRSTNLILIHVLLIVCC